MISRRILHLASLAVLLAGCSDMRDSLFGKKEPPNCPPVYILADAAKITKYRPGAGRDLTDVEGEAEIAGFKGDCGWDEEKGASLVSLEVSLKASRGPADTDRKLELVYFIAIPGFYPAPEAKAEMPVTIEFPEAINYARFNDEVVSLTIPIGGGTGEDYAIYIGFQTSAEELEQNRRGKR